VITKKQVTWRLMWSGSTGSATWWRRRSAW